MQVGSNLFVGVNQLIRSGVAAQITAKLTYIGLSDEP